MATERSSGRETKPQRLFAAVAIPAGAADAVEAAIAAWREAFPRARWVPRESWHVTLVFLGSTSPRLVPWVREQLAVVADRTPAFEACVLGLGAFPSTDRARVLWAGLDDDPGTIGGLAAAVQSALAHEFPPEPRPFLAHLTVARSNHALALPPAFAQTPLESDRFEIDALELMSSQGRRTAPLYERVATFPLGRR